MNRDAAFDATFDAPFDAAYTAMRWGGVRWPSTKHGFEGLLWLKPHG